MHKILGLPRYHFYILCREVGAVGAFCKLRKAQRKKPLTRAPNYRRKPGCLGFVEGLGLCSRDVGCGHTAGCLLGVIILPLIGLEAPRPGYVPGGSGCVVVISYWGLVGNTGI